MTLMQNMDINQLLDWVPNPALAELPVVQENEHRLGMRQFAAATTVITTLHQQQPSGLTATAVCSVTAEPARLVAFVNKNTYAAQQILQSGLLCINALAGDQAELACIFAGMRKAIAPQDRFQHGQWETLVTGAPVLGGAKANFDCRVVKVFDESTHYAFLCDVLATQSNEDSSALLYMGGAFYTLSATPVAI